MRVYVCIVWGVWCVVYVVMSVIWEGVCAREVCSACGGGREEETESGSCDNHMTIHT